MTDRIPIKSVLDIEARLVAIREVAYDYEKAHSLEDDLWEDVLIAIASGRTHHARALAAEALKSRDIPFDRHCA